MGFILQYYKLLLPQFNIFPSTSIVLLYTHLRGCLSTKLSCSERIIHKLSHCTRPDVLAAVSMKIISLLRYNTTLYDKNFKFLQKVGTFMPDYTASYTKKDHFITSVQMSLHDTNKAHTDAMRSTFQSLYTAFKERPIKLTNTYTNMLSI
jgi:hypothetical protein